MGGSNGSRVTREPGERAPAGSLSTSGKAGDRTPLDHETLAAKCKKVYDCTVRLVFVNWGHRMLGLRATHDADWLFFRCFFTRQLEDFAMMLEGQDEEMTNKLIKALYRAKVD